MITPSSTVFIGLPTLTLLSTRVNVLKCKSYSFPPPSVFPSLQFPSEPCCSQDKYQSLIKANSGGSLDATLLPNPYPFLKCSESLESLAFAMLLPNSYSSVSSVQFSGSDMSDSLRPHESQHARPPCPSPTPGVYSNSEPTQMIHPRNPPWGPI